MLQAPRIVLISTSYCSSSRGYDILLYESLSLKIYLKLNDFIANLLKKLKKYRFFNFFHFFHFFSNFGKTLSAI